MLNVNSYFSKKTNIADTSAIVIYFDIMISIAERCSIYIHRFICGTTFYN